MRHSYRRQTRSIDLKKQHGCGSSDSGAAPKKMTAFEGQVAKDWRRFKEKYFACTEYPDARRAMKKSLAAEEKDMAGER